MASKFSTQPLEQGSRLLFRLLDSSVAGYSQSLRYTGVGIAAGLVGGGLFSAFLVPRHERSTSNNTLAAATGMLHEVSRNRLQWSTHTPLATPRRRGAHYRECCGGCVLRTWLHRRLLEVFQLDKLLAWIQSSFPRCNTVHDRTGHSAIVVRNICVVAYPRRHKVGHSLAAVSLP